MSPVPPPRPIPPGRHVILCCDCEGNQRQLSRIYRAIEEAGVPANWFFVGQTVRLYPSLVREIASRHQTESHTMNHPNLRQLSRQRQRAEIMDGRRAVEDCIGRATTGFRAPMHHLNRDTVDILNEEGFRFDASRLYFRYDMRDVIEIDPTWFREWMPLYGQLGISPRRAFGFFRWLTTVRQLCVLPVHPHYSGLTREHVAGFRWFLKDAVARGVRFWSINDWLAVRYGPG
jgi:peptidoglycan/xylan/chitin deacetylase (PgdA/CDA1 family)